METSKGARARSAISGIWRRWKRRPARLAGFGRKQASGASTHAIPLRQCTVSQSHTSHVSCPLTFLAVKYPSAVPCFSSHLTDNIGHHGISSTRPAANSQPRSTSTPCASAEAVAMPPNCYRGDGNPIPRTGVIRP